MLVDEKPNTDMEEQLNQLFRAIPFKPDQKSDQGSLEQPPAYEEVESVTTYGLYEQPILG